MTSTTRFAIIGAGVIGQIHAQAIQSIPDASVTWVADQDLERAERVARLVDARPTADAAAAAGASDTDAVLVAVPTHHHRAIVELAAAHGKHVLCEKPIAGTVAGAEALIAACERAGVRLMVGQVVRHFPECARVKEVLDAGTLGQIGVVRTSRVGSSPVATRPWMLDPHAGGGVVIDLMIHELDTLRWFFGEVARVYALGAMTLEDSTPVEYVQAVLRFESGVVAHVEASWAHQGFRTRLEIAGQHGLLRHDSNDALPIRLERAGSIELIAGRPEGPYTAQLRHFIDCLHTGEPFLAGGEDGLRALEAALAVSASARTGRPVTFTGGRPMMEGATA